MEKQSTATATHGILHATISALFISFQDTVGHEKIKDKRGRGLAYITLTRLVLWGRIMDDEIPESAKGVAGNSPKNKAANPKGGVKLARHKAELLGK